MSCAHVNPAPDTAACKANRSAITWYADESFTPPERAAILAAPVNWSTFSHGRIQNAVTFDSPAPPLAARIRRVVTTDQVVKDENARETLARGTVFVSLGWSERPVLAEHPRELFVVMDLLDVADRQLERVVTHEMGHAAGLRWPGCPTPDPFQKCDHSPVTTALMNNAVGNNDLGPADLAFCEASCLCD